MFSLITKDKNFYHSFFSLCGLLVLQNVITHSVNLADNVMIGSYSEAALSGIAAVNQIQFILNSMVGAAGEGLVVMATQYWGQHRTEPIKKLTSIALAFGLGIAMLFFLLVSLFPNGALRLFTKDTAVITEGVKYLKIVSWTYPFFGITMVLISALKSVETVKMGLVVSLSTLVVNCSLNYILIFGRFGAPELGTQGAAIATLAARIVEFIIILFYILFRDKKLKLRFSDLKIDRSLLKDYWKVSFPVFVNSGLWGASNALQTMILGHMTASAIAANSIASSLYQLLKVASVGAAASASIIIGKTVGSGDMKKIKEYSKTLQVLFICIGITISAAMFLLRAPLLSLYNLSAETKEMANTFLLILCVTIIGMSYEMPTFGGIIKGGGDTKAVMINDLISIWGIVIPLSLAAAFLWKLPPAIVLICLNSDQVFKCLPAAIYVNRYKWVRKLTK